VSRVATKGFVSRHVLAPCTTANRAQPDLLSWTDPPPKYSEEPTAANELLSLLDPLSASANQPRTMRSGSAADLKSAGLDYDVFLPPYVSIATAAAAAVLVEVVVVL